MFTGAPNPRPDLPVLLVVSRGDDVERLRSKLDPKEFIVITPGIMPGVRARMILRSLDLYRHELYQSGSVHQKNAFYDFLEWLPTRLAVECQGLIFDL